MKKILSFILLFCVCSVSLIHSQERLTNTIDDEWITISVPKYNEYDEVEYKHYQKKVPTDVESAKKDIATILSAYNSTITSYNEHIQKLEKELHEVKSQLEEVNKLYEGSINTLTAYNNIYASQSENLNQGFSLLPKFGISSLYGYTSKDNSHSVILLGDVYFGSFKVSLGPIIKYDQNDTLNKTTVGISIGLGYKF